ncbi:MAG: hypothetical protein AAB404_03035 [Patescibacteria group bacterium]
MKLRDSIDSALSFGLVLETAVVIMFRMGKKRGDKEESDISQLRKAEIRILANNGFLTKQEIRKYLKGNAKRSKNDKAGA